MWEVNEKAKSRMVAGGRSRLQLAQMGQAGGGAGEGAGSWGGQERSRLQKVKLSAAWVYM